MFTLIAGPCVVENESEPLYIAEYIQEICLQYQINFIFKASYRKANRTHLDSFQGIGDERALNVLRNIKEKLQIPVLTDIHTPQEADIAAEYVDWLQIPAFLCRQTDLLIAAGKTGKGVNIKKGQFLSPESMIFAVQKVQSTGNQQIMLTERGSFFGYQDLVVDFRSIPIMQQTGCSVIVDCTHSLQKPNQSSGVSGGDPKFIQTISRAAIAVGAEGLFIETHPQPSRALSDAQSMLPLSELKPLLSICCQIKIALNSSNLKEY
ncbi:MAG: 3-deoxy-8-phosphooctulonate synthase [Bacteroidia bacterium]|nr:3-deoxy-8-phosphooctulonate synthase [Bacteroidia bacterium]MDW8159072.1 3-deoxy-8-phosphooctulonate synthase [Bacteroidia bacterium]